MEIQTQPKVAAVDLFCGVGGLTHGLVRGGIDVRAGIDVDSTCRYPYEANNKTAKFLEFDVASMSADVIVPYLFGANYTLLAGCAPCQPFSSYSQGGRASSSPAGTKGNGDWKLVAKFGVLVEETQPDLVTMENVSQLAGHPVFKKFLKSLRGYHVWWNVVECSTLGVPQSRRRLVLMASKLGELQISSSIDEKSIRTVRQTIGRLPQIAAGQQDPTDQLHFAPNLSAKNMERIKASIPGGTWRDWPPSLQADCHRKFSGATYPSVYGRMEWDKVAPTITTQSFGYGNGRFGHPEQDRAISLREAAMLQTFPRSYRFVAPGQPVRFNRMGRLIGNAVPVRLGEVIGESIVRHVREVAQS